MVYWNAASWGVGLIDLAAVRVGFVGIARSEASLAGICHNEVPICCNVAL